MKACPYCGQQIQDEAIKCRFCRRDLRGAPAQAAPVPPSSPEPDVPVVARVGEGAIRFSHSGSRYLLGYGTDFFGVWDRETPGGPIHRYVRSDDGWRQAWTEYSAMEPHSVSVDPTPAPSGPPPAAVSPAWATAAPAPTEAPRPVSPFLWILPVLLGWLGGLGAWFMVRNRDPRTARNMLLTGIVVSVVGIVLLTATH